MTIKQLFLSLFFIIGTTQICHAQQWVYNSSGTEIMGSYRYASLTSGANDNPRSPSIYINYYKLNQKYNIYLYEITGLECSDNTIQYFTDTNETPQSFSVMSKSDGIETIAMTEIEDLSSFLNEVQKASLLTISIQNTCGTGRDILFPMDNATEAVDFMTPSQEQGANQNDNINDNQNTTQSVTKFQDPSTKEVQEQVSTKVQEQVASSSIKPAQSKVMDSSEIEEMESSPKTIQEQVSTKAQEQVSSSSLPASVGVNTEQSKAVKEVQVQVSSSSINTEQSAPVSTPEPEQNKSIMSAPQGANTNAEWARLTKRNKELDRKDSLLVAFQAQLDERELALILKEQQLEAKARQTQNSPAVVSAPVQTSPVSPSPTIVQSISYPYRYVQFVATTGGKSYDQLSYIGQIISEQIPGKNITRYKVMGQWSDADIARVKNQLAQEGFQGAFESK